MNKELPTEPSMYRVPYGKTRLGGIVPNNIAGTLSASSHEYNELVIEPIMQQNTGQIMQIGNTTENAKRENPQRNRVYSAEGITPTVCDYSGGGNHEPQILELVTCAMRGRNPDNPSDRTSGILTEQRLEMGDDIANCITTVQKDSLVAEPMALGYSRDSKPDENGVYHTHRKFTDVMNALCPCRRDENECLVAEPTIQFVGNIYPSKAQSGKVVSPDDIAPTVCENHGEVTRITEPVQYYYRIRKLTPKECFRLMDVDDPDIDKLIEAKDAKGKPMLSKSASYKLSGNSIAISCLFYIFEGLFYGDNTNPNPQLTLF